jgi:hypothetical protein
MADQMQILRQEIMDLNRQLCASQMVYDKYTKQSEQKGKGPALPDHPAPERTPERRGPSSSSAREHKIFLFKKKTFLKGVVFPCFNKNSMAPCLPSHGTVP